MIDWAGLVLVSMLANAEPAGHAAARLQALQPQLYHALHHSLEASPRPEPLVAMTRRHLAQHGLVGEVTGRTKSLASLHKKVLRKGVPPEQIYDRTALRVIVPTEADCYKVMASLKHRFAELPGESDDYIQHPKASGYRSLHAALRAGPQGEVVEFQVRTPEMHAEAETGVAAHWRYKLQA